MKTIIRPILRWLAVLALLTLALPASAQSLEILQLRHRSADEVLPQLQPFVEAGGALTGMQDKLFVRASARNLAQLRELVAALDTPRRRLMISLRSESATQGGADGAGIGGAVSIIDGKVGARGTASIYSSDRQRSNEMSSQVQTLNGGRATLYAGQSYLLPMRQIVFGPGGVIVSETLVQRDVGSGFVAVPRLTGDTVTVEISPQVETLVQPGRPSGPVESQRLYTTVSGRLGEWIALGGADESAASERDGIGHYGTRRNARQGRLLLKIEALD